MNIVGRFNEINKLRDSLQNKKSELVTIYGRRRIGKTFLIREVLKDNIIFDLTGLHNGSAEDQLLNFYNQLKKRSKKFDKQKQPQNWFDAFDMLKTYIDGLKTKHKKVLFIDEFPWIATTRSKFLMWFENF